MKSYLRESYASKSTLRLVEKIVRRGPRSILRKFNARGRQAVRAIKEGGFNAR